MTHELDWLNGQAELSLKRLLPRLKTVLDNSTESGLFLTRLHRHFPMNFRLLYELYGDQYHFSYHLEQILTCTAEMYISRSVDLKALDQQREQNPLWFKSEQMVGGVCYVDLFAGDLSGLRSKIPYFVELGLTYLHLMPLFRQCVMHVISGNVSNF